MKIYFDNAASTPLAPEVIEEMTNVMKNQFGNPSSVHSFGRESRVVIETARKKIAKLLNASTSEIFFTSGGTEADNMAIQGCVNDLGIKRIITSPIEHYAVLYSVKAITQQNKAKIEYVSLTKDGHINTAHLEELLDNSERSLVALMHANNEMGNMINMEEVAELCSIHDAVFMSDTVQTMGHFPFNLSETKLHFISASAHKFHGPKGTGFIYIDSNLKLKPLLYGGSQERNMRAGTENLYGIAGMARALELSYSDLENHHKHILKLKYKMMSEIKNAIPDAKFVGDPAGNSLYTILTVVFPETTKSQMLLYNLDIDGVAVSGGSACVSGAAKSSHVMMSLYADDPGPVIKFSVSRYNTNEEVHH